MKDCYLVNKREGQQFVTSPLTRLFSDKTTTSMKFSKKESVFRIRFEVFATLVERTSGRSAEKGLEIKRKNGETWRERERLIDHPFLPLKHSLL
mmetsp:Transcript_41273/g.47563  ORF Transcript_41273/g.47563 Transcript_41273/m.47563 type:complete len:94 (+) Transcript_41273:484-765(+)